MPGIGSMSQFRASLWSNAEKLIDQFYDICAQIVQLQKILIKKRDILLTTYSLQQTDSNENVVLNKLLKQKIVLSSVGGDSLTTNGHKYDEYEQTLNSTDDPSTMAHKSQQSVEFLYEYWRILVSILNTNLTQVCIQSNYIKQTFHNEYPKLLKLYNDLWLRIVQLNPLVERYVYLNQKSNCMLCTEIVFKFNFFPSFFFSQNAKANSPAQIQSGYELLRKCFVELENSYLARSLTNLFDPINLIFSQNTTQSSLSDQAKKFNTTDIDQFVKQIQVQIQTIQYDITIAQLNASNIDEKIIKEKFSYKVVNTLCKAIKMFANKCEQYLSYNHSNSGLDILLSNGFYKFINRLAHQTDGFPADFSRVCNYKLKYS
jgi:hypothetical protein